MARILAILAFIISFGCEGGVDTFPVYEHFVELASGYELKNGSLDNRYVFLKPGIYEVDNPINIRIKGHLFIHGGDRIETVLKAKNPFEPMFNIEGAKLINVAGIRFVGSGNIDNIIFSFRNTSPIKFEMLDCFIDGGSIDIKGAGSFRLQSTYINNRAITHAPVVVDHPGADFLSVGGNMTTGRGESVKVGGDDIYNVWQKRGRVRIYGAGVQYSVGKADFRIDTASRLGPHVLAYVRSEGTNGYRIKDLPSSLLYVPPSDENVDVLLMANGGQWPEASRNMNHLINYNAAGTVWLIGNSSPQSANRIAVGKAKESTIVALGNRIFSRKDRAFDIDARIVHDIGNSYSHFLDTEDKTYPYVRFLNDDKNIIKNSEFHPVPKVDLPEPLTRPAMMQALSGMIDVKRDFGAKGDGVTDDTDALQKAFVSGKQIYIPEGIYRITRPLGYSHHKYGSKMMKEGGWIAGAGKKRTIIRRDFKDRGTVFTTDGMGYFTIQGISFETAPYLLTDGNKTAESAVELEFNPEFHGAFATQEVIFYDCKFDGGKHAVSIGLKSGTMGSENMFINSEFMNSGHGLAIGSYNALNNIVYGGFFSNNEVTIGHDKEYKTGGTASLLNVDIVNTRDREIEIHNSAGSPWYFHGVNSKTNRLFSSGHSSKPLYMIFDQCNFNSGKSESPWIEAYSGGGIYFLYSSVVGGSMKIQPKMSVFPVFSLYSDITGFSRSEKNENTRLYEVR